MRDTPLNGCTRLNGSDDIPRILMFDQRRLALQSLVALLRPHAVHIRFHSTSLRDCMSYLSRQHVDLTIVGVGYDRRIAQRFLHEIGLAAVSARVLVIADEGLTRTEVNNLVQFAADAGLARRIVPSRKPDHVTDVQGEVLRGVCDGLRNAEIALRVNRSENMIKSVLQHLFRKAGVRNRTELVRVAAQKFPRWAGSGTDGCAEASHRDTHA